MNRAYFAGNYYVGNTGVGKTTIVKSPIPISGAWLDYTASGRQSPGKVWYLIDINGVGYSIGYNFSFLELTSSIPVSIARPGSYTMVASANSGATAAFIDGSDGSIWTVGHGAMIGNNTTTASSSPVSIARPGSYSKIIGGSNLAQFFAIDGSDGSVWVWGSNTNGQLGDNTITGKSSPVSIARPDSYKQVSIGAATSLFIDGTGSVWASGSNASGAIGNNTANNYSSPVSIARPGSYTMVASGNGTSFFLDGSDGSVWWCGYGLGYLSNSWKFSSPVSLARPGSYSYIACCEYNAAFIDASDGSLWTQGTNYVGQLGDGTTITRSSPVSVLGNRSYVSVKLSRDAMYAMTADNTMYVWGSDYANFMGRQIQVNTTHLIPILTTSSFAKIQNGVFLDTDGNVFCTGTGGNGNLGNNTLNDSTTLVPIARPGSYKDIGSGMQTSAGFESLSSSAALDGTDGSIWVWGNACAERYLSAINFLGNNSENNASSPVSLARPDSYTSIFYHTTCAFAIDGATGMVWGWGVNASGQLGDNTTTTKSSPVSTRRPGSYIQAFSSGNSSFFIDSTGSVWATGSAGSGVLGNNTTTSSFSPVSIARPGSYKKVTGYTGVTYFLDGFDGSVWATGTNSLGQLGDGTLDNKSSPVSMLGGRSYTNIIAVPNTLYLLTADGTVYALGDNTYGQFGNGTTVGSSIPIALPFSNVLAIHPSASQGLILTIDAAAPIVDTQPSNAIKVQGETAQFTVIAHGNPIL